MAARARRSTGILAAVAMMVAALVNLPAVAAEGEGAASLPRFASLRSEQVNLRAGPGSRYPIEWVLTRKDMPVEIIAEFENWRRIRDWQGTEGWVHQRMLTSKRAVIVKTVIRALRSRPDASSAVLARVEPGVLARLRDCQGAWCRVETGDVTGWIQRSEVWGVYADEVVR